MNGRWPCTIRVFTRLGSCVADFENWEICDSYSMRFFTSGPLVDQKIAEWTLREETYVKKAVKWALREIGKRNIDLYQQARAFAERLQSKENKSAHWIARDALREFDKPNLAIRGYPRGPYQKEKLEGA